MYLQPEKIKALSQLMCTLAEPYSDTDLRLQIGTHLLDLLDADYYASYAWSPVSQRFEDGVSINMSSENFAAYDAYYQYCDPVTPLLKERRSASLVVEVIDQKALLQTEFFNDFLKADGLYWGANLYAWDDKNNVGDIRIWRQKGRENFDAQTLVLLNLVQPAFTAAINRGKLKNLLPEQIKVSFDEKCLLSDRERQIIDLISLGKSDKEIAQKLGIGFTTVRTHIGKAMRKLGAKNRVQLATIERSF